MIEATSCGGVVIHRGKILALYKSYRNRYEGWVLPKGTVEKGETFEQTALREVMEEAGVRASIVKYIGKSQYNFTVPEDVVMKEVHWYLMIADNYHSKPQREEYFVDSGYYKFHEIYHLLRFSNEKHIVEQAMQIMEANGYEIPSEDEEPEQIQVVAGWARHIPFLRNYTLEKQIVILFVIIAVFLVLLIFFGSQISSN